MLDGGHIAAVNCSAAQINVKQKQSNIIQFAMDDNHEKDDKDGRDDEKMDKKKVCIDAGHGGTDPGAVGQYRTKEKDIALAVSRLVGEALERCGVEVCYTRTSDQHVSLDARAKTANEAGADAFVSIHCNSASNKNAHGTETYAYSKNSAGYSLAQVLQKALIAATDLADRGTKTANFAVLRGTSMAAALVELAFISNSYEEALINKTSWQAQAAEAIAKGIVQHLGVVWVPAVETEKPIYNLRIDEVSTGEVRCCTIKQENRGGTIWAPVRQVVEALGYQIGYDNTSMCVVIYR